MDKIDKLLKDIDSGKILKKQVQQASPEPLKKANQSSSGHSGTRLVCMSADKEDKTEGK